MEASLIADFVIRNWCPRSDAELADANLDEVWLSPAEDAEEWLKNIGQATRGFGPPMLFHLRLAEENTKADGQTAYKQDGPKSAPKAAAYLGGKQAVGRISARGISQFGKGAIHDMGHVPLSEALLGKPYPGVHKFMDRASGGYHRWVGHGLADIAKVGKRFAGRSGTFNQKAAAAAVQHIFQDFFTSRGIPLVGKQTAERLSRTLVFRALGADTAAKVSKLLALNFPRAANILMWAWCVFDVYRLVRDIRTDKVIAAAYCDAAEGNPGGGLSRLEQAVLIHRGWKWHKACGEIRHIAGLSALARGHPWLAGQHLDKAIADLRSAREACKRKEILQVDWPEGTEASTSLPRIEANARGVIGLSLVRCLQLRRSLPGHSPDLGDLPDEVAEDLDWQADRAWQAFLGRHLASAVQNHLYAVEVYLEAGELTSEGIVSSSAACARKVERAVQEYDANGEGDARELWGPELPRARALASLISASRPAIGPGRTAPQLAQLASALRSLRPASVSELRGWQKAIAKAVDSCTQGCGAEAEGSPELTAEQQSAIAHVLSVLPLQPCRYAANADDTSWRLEAAHGLFTAGELATKRGQAVYYYSEAAEQLSCCGEHLHAAQVLDTALQYASEFGPRDTADKLEASMYQSLEAALAEARRPPTMRHLGGRAELRWYTAHVTLAQAQHSGSAERLATAVGELVAAGDVLLRQDRCVLSRGVTGLSASGPDASAIANLEALAAIESGVDEGHLSLCTAEDLRRQALRGLTAALER